MMELHAPPKRHLDANREFPPDVFPVRNAIRRGVNRVHGICLAMPQDIGILMRASVKYPEEFGRLLHEVLYQNSMEDADIPIYIRGTILKWDLDPEPLHG